jgi:acyl-CoA synthetase (AMP-forming)/AMP-acid ligase II
VSVGNVSLRLAHHAAEAPDRIALRTFGTRATTLTFAELETRVQRWAAALASQGLGPGDRTALFVPPGAELVGLFHALLRLGAVPVLIDPGMGARGVVRCLERTRPRAFVGVARAHLLRWLAPRAFASVAVRLRVGPGLAPGARVLEPGAPLATAHEPLASSPAAVLFTSGSTGPAKGVVTTHAHLEAQLEALRALYGLEPGDVHAACFPLFAFFDGCLGMTSAFPELDPARPAACDPRAVVRSIEASGATFSFGSPAIWRRVLPWLRAERHRFTHLSRVTIAGAPVPPALVLGLAEHLAPGGRVHTPYGATEALPVCDVAHHDLAARRERIEGGEGSCVGRPVPGVRLELIGIQDDPIERLEDASRPAPGEPGEICVSGPAVTVAYLDDEEATRAAKMRDAEGRVWHRMGDLGRLDDEGNLWFLGRKSQRLETERGVLFPTPHENRFDTIPGVARSALVGVGPRGRERAHLVIEPEPGARLAEVRARVEARLTGSPVEAVHVRRRLPVDVRHNAKIRREDLKRWLESAR